MSTYADTLNHLKSDYPFDRMRKYWQDPEDQEACHKIEQGYDELIASLIELGPDASEASKIACFEQAIAVTNDYDGVIETGEREDLCELTNSITIACGLDPNQYGSGEGLASEWRNW